MHLERAVDQRSVDNELYKMSSEESPSRTDIYRLQKLEDAWNTDTLAAEIPSPPKPLSPLSNKVDTNDTNANGYLTASPSPTRTEALREVLIQH